MGARSRCDGYDVTLVVSVARRVPGMRFLNEANT